MSDHAPHLWHEDAAGVVRCGFMDCAAEPTELEAAQAIAEAEARTAAQIELDYATT